MRSLKWIPTSSRCSGGKFISLPFSASRGCLHSSAHVESQQWLLTRPEAPHAHLLLRALAWLLPVPRSLTPWCLHGSPTRFWGCCLNATLSENLTAIGKRAPLQRGWLSNSGWVRSPGCLSGERREIMVGEKVRGVAIVWLRFVGSGGPYHNPPPSSFTTTK